jgi:hypothetical protein
MDLTKVLGSRLKMPLKSGLIFWAGGFLAWVLDKGIVEFYKWYTSLKPVEVSLTAFWILLVMAFSTAIITYFNVAILRLLEGYFWPKWLASKWKNVQDVLWIDNARQRFADLAKKRRRDNLTAEEEREFAKLDKKLMYIPADEVRLPTQLGNILRTAELRPGEKYGLNAFICFPRLWLLMPGDATKALVGARENLDNTTHVWMWSFLFMFWGVYAPWAVPIGLVFTFMAYRWMLQSAEIYGQLVESAFDVHRKSLYESLRWPLPANPSEEHKMGEKLTAYLWRGSDLTVPTFTDDRIFKVDRIKHE